MTWLKRWVKDFFGFSRAQVNGFIILIPLLAIILLSEPLWHWYKSRRKEDFSANRAKLDSLVMLWESKRSEEPQAYRVASDQTTDDFFHFNPNIATVDELNTLGFSSTLSNRIAHYREKGGKFRIRGDLLKIYGLDTSFYKRLYAFIDLPEKEERKKSSNELRKVVVEKSVTYPKVDLNRADTFQLKKVYGIGDRLSARIVKYRNALGGFVAFNQVREVYGLDSTVINRLLDAFFVEDDFQPLKININTADETILATHPYLRKATGRAIVTYRFQHGEFKALDDLRKIHVLDDKTIQKIAPYLTVDD